MSRQIETDTTTAKLIVNAIKAKPENLNQAINHVIDAGGKEIVSLPLSKLYDIMTLRDVFAILQALDENA